LPTTLLDLGIQFPQDVPDKWRFRPAGKRGGIGGVSVLFIKEVNYWFLTTAYLLQWHENLVHISGNRQ
jgi:hypothetical protein